MQSIDVSRIPVTSPKRADRRSARDSVATFASCYKVWPNFAFSGNESAHNRTDVRSSRERPGSTERTRGLGLRRIHAAKDDPVPRMQARVTRRVEDADGRQIALAGLARAR